MAWIYTGSPATETISPPTAQVTYYVDGGAGTNTVNTNAPFVQGAFTYSQNQSTGVTTLSGASGTGLKMYLHNVQLVAFTNGTWTVPAITDTTPPTATFSPASGATGVAINSPIVLTFSEAIQLGTGSIVLKTAGGTVIETFDAATSNRLLISNNSPTAPNAPILTITPTYSLANSTQYFLTIAHGAIKDITGNAYAGTTTYNFTTIAGTAIQANILNSWNLLGNSVNSPLNVATSFGDPNKISSVWKWIKAGSKWAFYTPSMTSAQLSAYASSKGYDVLSSINGGEGFWVNALIPFTLSLPAGIAIPSSQFADTNPVPLSAGWSLLAVGDNPTPKVFVNTIANLTSLWAWDSATSSWYFYAPSLDNNGTLQTYITSKGYLDFASKTLGRTTGFWGNHP